VLVKNAGVTGNIIEEMAERLGPLLKEEVRVASSHFGIPKTHIWVNRNTTG